MSPRVHLGRSLSGLSVVQGGAGRSPSPQLPHPSPGLSGTDSAAKPRMLYLHLKWTFPVLVSDFFSYLSNQLRLCYYFQATLFQIHIFALSTTGLGKKHLYFSRKNHRENYPEETRQVEALCLVTEASFVDQEEMGFDMSHSFYLFPSPFCLALKSTKKRNITFIICSFVLPVSSHQNTLVASWYKG